MDARGHHLVVPAGERPQVQVAHGAAGEPPELQVDEAVRVGDRHRWAGHGGELAGWDDGADGEPHLALLVGVRCTPTLTRIVYAYKPCPAAAPSPTPRSRPRRWPSSTATAPPGSPCAPWPPSCASAPCPCTGMSATVRNSSGWLPTSCWPPSIPARRSTSYGSSGWPSSPSAPAPPSPGIR